MNLNAAVDRIERAAAATGYRVARVSRAQTGTYYVYLDHPAVGAVTVRIAHHGEAYAPQRPERRLCVDPQSLTVAQAVAALRAPQSIPIVERALLTDDQVEALRAEAAREAAYKTTWQALRQAWAERGELNGLLSEFRGHGANRSAARAIAARLKLSVAQTWSALTNGRRWNR